MATFHFQPTTIAEWQLLVAEAEIKTGYEFEESIENYLVLTLDHYTQKNELVTSVIALEFLESTQMNKPRDGIQLRKVGDQCLLLSGLFPERAITKNVSLNYFIGIGQQAYLALTDIRLKKTFDPELYEKLSCHFIGLMDVLNAMRQ